MSWDTKHTNLAKLTRNSNWVWHCTLPHNWLPVPHSPTLHHFIVSWSYHATDDLQYPQPTPIWPGSSVCWAMGIYSERSCVQFPSWSEFFDVPTISMPNDRHVCLAAQQKFGLSVVNETLKSTLSMAREAVSLYRKNRWCYIFGKFC